MVSNSHKATRSESQVSSHLEIARAGLGVADYGESIIVDSARRGVANPAARAPRVGERHRVGQVESFTHQLELEFVLFEREGSIDALVELEKTGSAQDVSAGRSQGSVGRVGKCAAIVIRVTGIVAAQNLYRWVDLVRGVRLAGR